MRRKFSWRALFPMGRDHVTFNRSELTGETYATDRYSVWHVDPICKARGLEVPAPGVYKAMATELRRTGDAILSGQSLSTLFADRAQGASPDDRLVMSEWRTDDRQPIVRMADASVRFINPSYADLPRLGKGEYWVAHREWHDVNVAVLWSMYSAEPWGAVALVGSMGARREVWETIANPLMTYAIASEVVPHEAEKRYGKKQP